jgi:NADH:ubiquinone oxidoreductase subunit 3 (subunit A)
MTNFLFAPLVAFLVYFLVVAIASGLGFLFSAKGLQTEFKSGTFASGEESDPVPAAPGYRQFFVVALFFAVLHLGVLMLGTSGLSPAAIPYLLGLVLVLLALILG